MVKRRLVIGDIHGSHKGLIQVLERSNFNNEKDQLIQLGDICDGWPEVYQCVEELLKIKDLIAIRGNHDDLFRKWLIDDIHPFGWRQKGIGTLKSYSEQVDCTYSNSYKGYRTTLTPEKVPVEHYNFFMSTQKLYHIDNNVLFVHGGFNRHFPLQYTLDKDAEILYWDRDLWFSALSYKAMNNEEYSFKIKDEFKEIFIGHTPTINWSDKDNNPITTPMHAGVVWNLDTGAKYAGGKVTIMDIDTKEYWQSDFSKDLYK